jgi:hypothetical protein
MNEPAGRAEGRAGKTSAWNEGGRGSEDVHDVHDVQMKLGGTGKAQPMSFGFRGVLPSRHW